MYLLILGPDKFEAYHKIMSPVQYRSKVSYQSRRVWGATLIA